VVGSEVIHDREEQVAEIWNARFKLGPVPVFYSPYLQLPVGDKRRSGFLIPNAKYSTTNYFEFYLPYYWNIAPTWTPRSRRTISTSAVTSVGERIPLSDPGRHRSDGV
jgi:lipopolysaccharide assembly outer membrane protein LptD (OstA)